jgi:diacylglycerol kinase (ATP)
MTMKGAKGFRRLWLATIYSMRGLRWVFAHESAFRQELFLAVLLAPLGLMLGKTGLERALLVGVLLLVLIVELLNSGIEAAIDRFGGEIHEFSGRAKDAGSAAVFLSLLNVPIVWVLVLFG